MVLLCYDCFFKSCISRYDIYRKMKACKLKMVSLCLFLCCEFHNIESNIRTFKIYKLPHLDTEPIPSQHPAAITGFFEKPCSNALNLPWPPRWPQRLSNPESDVQPAAALSLTPCGISFSPDYIGFRQYHFSPSPLPEMTTHPSHFQLPDEYIGRIQWTKEESIAVISGPKQRRW